MLHVLVAEDDRISRRVLARYLEKWGYSVTQVESGEQAWEQITKDPSISVAILDWMMPGLSGIDLCRKVREELTHNHLYVILLTGKTEKQDMYMAFDAGADDFISKPFEPLELSSRLNVGRRLYESREKLRLQNIELERYAKEMESLAEERAKMLLHADRLASLGVLSAGIAHEINNPATFIAGNAQTLERCWPFVVPLIEESILKQPSNVGQLKMLLSEVPQMLGGIRQGVRRISLIVNGLKSFARSGHNEWGQVDLNACIEQSLLLCKSKLMVLDKIVKELEQDLPEISGDNQKLEQVFVNLFVNAVDAMEGTRNERDAVLTLRTFAREDKVIAEVCDTGKGISPDKIDQIWKPFFTTKEVGKGTGLGLSLSEGIISSHGGKIRLENRPSGGAKFVLEFPRSVNHG